MTLQQRTNRILAMLVNVKKYRLPLDVYLSDNFTFERLDNGYNGTFGKVDFLNAVESEEFEGAFLCYTHGMWIPVYMTRAIGICGRFLVVVYAPVLHPFNGQTWTNFLYFDYDINSLGRPLLRKLRAEIKYE